MSVDAFSKCHPAVNFLFFLGAIGFCVTIQHPAWLLAGVLCGLVYYLLLRGRKGLPLLAGLVPLFFLISAVNPLFNTQGSQVLFWLLGRPYTWEALLFGCAVAAILVATLIWFGCYNQVLTSDKFTTLFGNRIPSVSLLLVMVLRLVPNLMRKAKQLLGARKAIGKGTGQNAGVRQKLRDGSLVLGALTSWAMEGSVVTGDSMRARGYGTAKRTSFMRYRLTLRDWLLLALMGLLAGGILLCIAQGGTAAQFVPCLALAPLEGWGLWGFLLYCIYLLLPTVLQLKEVLVWHISRSRI